jgi:LAS superfamily LD-carboxypeptidase LdcB
VSSLVLFSTAGSLSAQNAEADRLHLPRIQTKNELHEIVQNGELAQVCTPALRVKPTGDHAYLRPWAAVLAESLAEDFYEQAHVQLTLTSGIRTVQEQRSLRRWNHNAAAPAGPQASVHTTGIAFDISRTGLSRAQQKWLEVHLWYLQQTGKVIVEEEQKQPCFHIVVLQQ